MEINPRFFHGGCVKDWLKLSDNEIRYFMGHAPQNVKTSLMYLEVWAHMCYYRKPKEAILKKLRDEVKIRPEKGAQVLIASVSPAPKIVFKKMENIREPEKTLIR